MTDQDVRDLLERMATEEPVPFLDAEPLTRRARRRATRTVVVGALGVAAAIAVLFAGASQLLEESPRLPADPPEDAFVDLGIFAPISGKIVYYEDSSLWGVDPNAPSPDSTLVRLDLGGTADADRFAHFTVPLGWSSDGTKLLFIREGDRADLSREPPFPRYLYILHADGTETQVTSMTVDAAAISPDGSRVVFAADGAGLYVVDAEGGQPVRIAEEGESPTFSPDGTQIAYLSEVPDEHVWVANADGTDAHEILADGPALAEAFELTWSPAGDRIAMASSPDDRVSISTFAPDGSDLTMVITGGFNPHWSPDGSQIAYRLPTRGPSDAGGAPLAIADADGSNVQVFDFGGVGPWHPGAIGAPVGEDALDPTPSGFVGGWAATDYNDHSGGLDSTPPQTMTIRAGEDGVLHITIHDGTACVPDGAALTMTGTGRLEDPTTLVVPSPDLACVEGGVEASDRVDLLDGYTLVLDPETDRLYDSLGVVWNRGAPAESWTGASTEAGVDGPGTYSILYREVSFRAPEPWNDHLEAYIDPRTFFLIGPGDAEMTMLVNPLAPEAPCGRRVQPSAEELVKAIRSNPNLETTAPVVEAVGGVDALRMDVVAAPGASFGPCTLADEVDVVSVPGRPWANVGPGELGRLYLLDLPGGSARTLAIWITAPSTAVFEQALDAAAPVLDSFEFQAP